MFRCHRLGVKDMLPRISNCELMDPVENVAVSIEKLRQRSVDEGVSETAIQQNHS